MGFDPCDCTLKIWESFRDFNSEHGSSLGCRNPTLDKCGGEAQHLKKVRIWSPPGLPNVQSSTARPKTPRIKVCSWCHWKVLEA
jgi:hypothetical protein